MLFKIGVLKNFCNIHWKTPVLAVEGLLLRNIYSACFWIFAAGNAFFQLVFIADNHNGFCSEPLWKHELNVRSSLQNYSVKKGVFRNFASFTEKQLR